MSKFKVGDRVRINCPDSEFSLHGKTGTIWKIVPDGQWRGAAARYNGLTSYRVDVDGVGKRGPLYGFFGYPASDLIHLVPPDELAWQKFREHLKPNPLVIFDADPITVSTEHEAEAIADRVPNSHIIVAVYRNGKRIVLSEYYGQSQSNRP